MLKLINVEKSYGDVHALKGVTMHVKQGEILALLAKNGSGKSTLVSIASGLLACDKGEVWINDERRIGKNLSKKNQSSIGMAGQDTGVYPELTIEENLLFYAQLYGLAKQDQKTRVRDVLSMLGLTNLKDRRANQLSGGEQRRLHMGAAILHKPRLLLLDEPTVGADPEARNHIIDTVKELSQNGTSIIYTSHYFPEIEQLNANIAIMNKGHLLNQGSQHELLSHYSKESYLIEFKKAVATKIHTKFPLSTLECPFKIRIPFSYEDSLSKLLSKIGTDADNIIRIEKHRLNLEQAFLTLVNAHETTS